MADSHKISPLAPKDILQVQGISGVRFATAAAGIKYAGRQDVLLMLFDEGTQVAGVFTRSKCPSAAVDWCRTHLSFGKARALIVNSGNANAFTGKKGVEAVTLTAEIVAKAAKIKTDEIFIASTGVIGEPLDASKFSHIINDLVSNAANQTLDIAAKAIMTTDTYPKLAQQTCTLDGQTITIAGIAKGAGMIAPDMATMLSFIFTNAPIAANILQECLAREVSTSFNAITVDGDTSTSDTVLLFATGTQNIAPITDLKDPRVKSFQKGLRNLLLDLAHQVVKDGEGATKFVEVSVQGAVSTKSAKKIAFAIANSPLVKTAIAGEDANWGRIVMAVGKAGESADRDRLSISFGDFVLAEHGERASHYDEAKVSAYMRAQNIKIGVDLHLGKGKATVWTCDLTKAYVEINGDYRS